MCHAPSAEPPFVHDLHQPFRTHGVWLYAKILTQLCSWIYSELIKANHCNHFESSEESCEVAWVVITVGEEPVVEEKREIGVKDRIYHDQVQGCLVSQMNRAVDVEAGIARGQKEYDSWAISGLHDL